MTRALRMLEHPSALLDHYIPHRTQSERGLSRAVLEQLKAGGATLVITTDCGSSDVEAVAYAKMLGLDVIITDHHEPPEQLPQACAVINPWRSDCTYGERYLCGVGIAFKVAQALFRIYDREREVRELLDLVAIGTIADVALLLGENHTLVQLGLHQLNHTNNPGLQALIQIARLEPGNLRERDIAYALGPRINAAGRMEHAGIAFDLLTTDDAEEARVLAQKLEELNQLRRQQTEALLILVREQAQDQLCEPVVLVAGPQQAYPEGIIGLVAGKLAEEIKRPVFVLSQDTELSRGSARSYGGFHLIEALRNRPDLFERHGGHAQAAGFTIANVNIEELRQHLLTWSARPSPIHAGVMSGKEDCYSQMVDMIVTRPEALDYAAYVDISQLSPFGAGNSEPILKMDNLILLRSWPSGPDGSTLQVRLQFGSIQFRGSYKNSGTEGARWGKGSHVNVIFSLLPALRSTDREDGQGIWLQVLHMEAGVGG